MLVLSTDMYLHKVNKKIRIVQKHLRVMYCIDATIYGILLLGDLSTLP